MILKVYRHNTSKHSSKKMLFKLLFDELLDFKRRTIRFIKLANFHLKHRRKLENLLTGKILYFSNKKLHKNIVIINLHDINLLFIK